MHQILEDAFLYDDVYGHPAIGFITANKGVPGQHVGYIVNHDTLGALYVALRSNEEVFLTGAHLQHVVLRIKQLNEKIKRAKKDSEAPP